MSSLQVKERETPPRTLLAKSQWILVQQCRVHVPTCGSTEMNPLLRHLEMRLSALVTADRTKKDCGMTRSHLSMKKTRRLRKKSWKSTIRAQKNYSSFPQPAGGVSTTKEADCVSGLHRLIKCFRIFWKQRGENIWQRQWCMYAHSSHKIYACAPPVGTRSKRTVLWKFRYSVNGHKNCHLVM